MIMSAFGAQAPSARQRSPTVTRRRMAFPQRSLVMRWMVSSAAIGSGPEVFPEPGSADAEEHLEQQLFPLVGGVEIGHAHLVARTLGALVRLAVDGLEVAEDAVAGARGGHGEKI